MKATVKKFRDMKATYFLNHAAKFLNTYQKKKIISLQDRHGCIEYVIGKKDGPFAIAVYENGTEFVSSYGLRMERREITSLARKSGFSVADANLFNYGDRLTGIAEFHC